jgi:hypothetical protein
MVAGTRFFLAHSNHAQTQAEKKATMANIPRLIHHGRPPSRAAAATSDATNLISGLRGTFCGSAAVVGGSGAE